MELRIGPIIGRGSTATVSLATTLSSGELVAVKSADLSQSTFLQKEQHFLSKMNSPYIVKYMGFNITNEQGRDCKPMYNLCMEYVAGGTLYDEIRQWGGKLEESMIRSYTCQILNGLDYLHTNGLVHCDIKSQNVLIGTDGAKIADLGCTKFAESVAMSAFSGTPAFMAPEVARGEEQDFAADIWAVGCTVIEMATGAHPWPEARDPISVMYGVGFSGDVPEIPGWMSEKGKDFLRQCLRRDPKERWTAKELLEHPFIADPTAENCSKDVKEINTTISPSSVLNNAFWDSLENQENLTQKSSFSSSSSDSDSPVRRIQQLIGSSISSGPNWDAVCDESWITVRSNETTLGGSYLNSDEEVDRGSGFDEELIWDSTVESSSSSDSGVSNDSIENGFVLLQCDCVGDDFVFENYLNYEKYNANSCFLQSTFTPILHFPFHLLSIANIIESFYSKILCGSGFNRELFQVDKDFYLLFICKSEAKIS